MSDATEQFSASVVLVGEFNPSIFSPSWITRTGLVSPDEEATATLHIIHADVAAFKIGNYSIDVRRNRFSIEVETEPLVQVLDAVTVIFGENLVHTPVTDFGLNYNEHFRLASAEKRTKLGRTLAPLGPWGEWGLDIDRQRGALTSGLTDYELLRNYDPPGSGERRIRVQPSAKTELTDIGVFMAVNDHRILLDQEEGHGAETALALLTEIFDESLRESRAIVDHMAAYARDLPL